MAVRIAIVGAGAAGCFCAVELRRLLPEAQITLYEAGKQPMAKLALTGGGRCNLTNSFEGVGNLALVYPRGFNFMKKALKVFDNEDVSSWFEDRGVRLTTQDDGRVFPASQDAMEIVNCLKSGMRGAKLLCSSPIKELPDADFVVLTCGGGKGMDILQGLDIEVVKPVPSLFSLKVDDPITRLQGISCDAISFIPGTKFRSSGNLLITDWGFSGPAILKLSSYAARHLAENNYSGDIGINWTTLEESFVRLSLQNFSEANAGKMLITINPFDISGRLWEYLLSRAGIEGEKRWKALGKKELNKLVSTLVSDIYPINGRAKFKDEFVTCGGVSLLSVDPKTLECRNRSGLYFAGEILDIDAITGGFNLQAAWTTAYIVSHAIFEKCRNFTNFES